ncbi:alkaline phosphatase-like protein [Tilletiaria anomala UBC 951]|uniref:Alkaline phosphatase n=1 Tax=Tilletiaria anomala (strain ATCC 24038 / CBS 436.72 / UBC 951) TaxID=1037660 RepID=A0A066WLR6_TILAU|nr:alkaline phosphatase-like protein [Tilletiaria anomala UBC 951]KDN53538.1 alkaline phosphatase-like protein [Tilletiaria anomala UBC 951]
MVATRFAQLSALLLLASSSFVNGKKQQRSVIQLISDGFGPASETFARSIYQYENKLPWDAELAQDKYVIGQIRTRASSSLVTDSAASATAYSCGLKSVNAYIGVDSDKKPCGTILEGAKAKGYNTALVTTSRVTHATPASWSAHIDDRDAEAEIALQQLGNYMLGRQVDILMGGGWGYFISNATTGSSRKDTRDLISEAKEDGWQVLMNRTAFEALENGKNFKYPTLGLFARSHMSYEIDRDPKKEPSLKEMAIATLNSLKKADKPFFIMIEGARIDHAAHNNDPIGHYHDILAYQDMVEAVSKWVDENDKGHHEPEIVMIGTSDHECGGLTLGVQRPEDKDGQYLWYPDVVARGTHSTEYLAADFLKQANASADEQRAYMVETIIKKGLGVEDANADEIQRALDLAKVKDSGLSLSIWLSSLVNWRAHLGWSTTAHSGTDVSLYYHESPKFTKTRSERIEEFRGNHENTWIAKWTSHWLKLDLQSITDKLNNGSYSWYTKHGNDIANFTVNLDKYHGGVARVVPALPASAAGRRDNVGYSYNDNLELLRDYSARSHRAARRSEL